MFTFFYFKHLFIYDENATIIFAKIKDTHVKFNVPYIQTNI